MNVLLIPRWQNASAALHVEQTRNEGKKDENGVILISFGVNQIL